MSDDEVRPRRGTLTRHDGEVIELRFIETSEPNVFLAVSQNGDRVSPMIGDTVRIDVLGPGQRVMLMPD